MQVDILGSKKLSLFIEKVASTFAEDQRLYRNEICLEAFAKILEPILCSGMVFLNIFKGGVVTMSARYVHLSIWIYVHFSFCLFSNW